MSKHNMSNLTQRLRVTAAILTVSSLGLFYPGTVSNLRAQSPSKAKSSAPSGGPKEGIKVHGSWTIDIRNPDGKLVSHQEFENALAPSGGVLLGQFLQRSSRPGEWGISLASASNALQPCRHDLGQLIPCTIYEVNSQAGVSNAFFSFKTLTISSEGGPNINKTVFTGSATARRDGVIDSVSTLLSWCPANTQEPCNPNTHGGHFAAWPFTQTNLPTPINVVLGQIIQVKVVISFS